MFATARRLWRIRRVAREYGLGELFGKQAPRWLFGRQHHFETPVGVRLREALTELGPVFIKFGQTLSTRRDLLPPGLAEELSLLQDEVPPFAAEQARELIEAGCGRRIDDMFADFDNEPLAAASIAQVHAATLHSQPGTQRTRDVVVKVLRPDVHTQVARDIRVLYRLAQLARLCLPIAARLRPVEVVAEYERIITDELNLLREGGNASQLGRNWAGSDLIRHPGVFFDYSCESVLVMERIHGIPIDNIEALHAAGVSFKALAERGVEIFFKQVFRDNFFHADMHPGNIFVDVGNPQRPQYIGVDFGIVGSLTTQDQRYLAENFLAFFNRDYRRIAELHIESGWMPADTSIEDFEGAIRTVSEPIFNKPLAEISFGIFMLRLFKVAQRYNYRVQPQLVLLQKTVLNVEGLGRDLYPQLDLWATAKPVLEEWMRQRASPKIAAERLREVMPELINSMPTLTMTLLQRLEQGTTPGTNRLQQSLDEVTAELRRNRIARRWHLAGTGLVIAAAVLAVYGALPLWLTTLPALAGIGAWLHGWRV